MICRFPSYRTDRRNHPHPRRKKPSQALCEGFYEGVFLGAFAPKTMIDMKDYKSLGGVFLSSAFCKQKRKSDRIGSAADGNTDAPGRKYRSFYVHCCKVYHNFGILCTIRLVSGRSSMAELQPSKLATRVRFPSPAPEEECGQSGVMAAAADSKSAVREYVRVRVPPLAPVFAKRMRYVGGVSEWSMVQPWKGCVGASPPGVRIPPPPPVSDC